MNNGSEKSRWGSMFHWLAMITMVVVAVVLLRQSPLLADEGVSSGDSAGSLGAMEYGYWGIAFVGSLVALAFAWKFYKSMIEADEGTPAMIEIAGHVRDGAKAYLTQQYKVVALFFVVIFGLLFLASFVLSVQS